MPLYAPLGLFPVLPLDSGTLALHRHGAPGPLGLDLPALALPARIPEPGPEALRRRADEAFDLHPGSCSHSVWHVIRLYRPQQEWLNANALIDQLSEDPQWSEVTVSEAGELARQGQLVVGGRKESGNGHVIVVYPGPDQPSGGYSFTRDGETRSVRARGSYPPAMSTSLGSWPGAMSRGDKTVWDPWANDARFATVRFWRYTQR